jgi:hypothetical protein
MPTPLPSAAGWSGVKRGLLFSFLLLVGFAAGFTSALLLVSYSRHDYDKEREAEFRRSITELRRRIYGQNDFHLKGVSPETESQLTAFDPAKSTGSITVSYVGGLDGSVRGSDDHLQLRADGGLYSEVHGSSQLITTIPPNRCADVFRRVLTSGILNYSEGVIELKKDLLAPESRSSVSDVPNTVIRISVPELKAEQTISICGSDNELENFPDIVEFQLISEIEKEIFDLVPKGYPLWK